MQAIVKAADDKTVADVREKAESGQLRNWLNGQYQSRGKIDVLGYRTNVAELRAGTSFMSTRPGTASGPPETVQRRRSDDAGRHGRRASCRAAIS